MKNSIRKNLICISVVAILFVGGFKADAQYADDYKKVEFGFRFMPTISSLTLKTTSGETIKVVPTINYAFGAALGFNFTNHVGIQGEVIYNSILQVYEDKDAERKINLKYINIPLLLSINTDVSKPLNFNFVAGPQVRINIESNISASGSNEANNTPTVLIINKGDIGFAYGAGLDFALNRSYCCRLNLGLRCVTGKFDISSNNKSIVANSYYIIDRAYVKTYSGYIGLSFLF